MVRPLIFAAAAGAMQIFALTAEDVSAQQRFYVAGWTGFGGSVNNGRYQYCGIARVSPGGPRVVLMLVQNGAFHVSLTDSRFDFGGRQWVSVKYRVDRHPPVWGQAKSSERNRIFFLVPSGRGIFRRMKTGNFLYVTIGGRTVRVSLYGTAAAIERMRECVVDRTDIAQGRRPRYASRRADARRAASRNQTLPRPAGKAVAKRNADAGTPSDASRRLEAVTYVANLLAKAGFRGYRILQQKEMRKQAGNRFDVVWRTSRSVGALRIYSGRQAKDFDELAARAIVLGTRACKGAFRSGVKREANSPVVRFFTQCDGDDGWHALYAIVRGKGGKAYLVLSLGNGLSDKESGTDLREVDERIVKAMTARQLD